MDHLLGDSYAYGMWPVALASIGIFIFFVLSYLKPKKRWEWQSMGAYGAFVVALFTEMYGFPLTIYILTSVLGSQYPVLNPFNHINGHLWVALTGGSTLVWIIVMVVSNVAMFGGLVIMGRAWKQIYSGRGKLVITGLYRMVRHPQYSALFLISIGMLIQWPTLVTAAMWPVLMYMYYRLSRREEKEMEAQFGEKYLAYRRQVPMFIPRLAKASRLTSLEA
ncbi:MAG: isoprenylcysteine carboxylmethyltransferase family protein [Chloroflexota bacterium]